MCRWARRFLSFAVALAAMVLAPLSFAQVQSPVFPKAAGEKCVEPTDLMRRSHFEFILHQRDRTVHEGIRTRQHSLAGCVSCHAAEDTTGTTLPVNAPGQFCQSCHEFTAVTMDCFECHTPMPDADGS
jgi:predicted CXXCH cytochrome family protein